MFICHLLYYYIFFFKQKTAYEMRISDWSSDVCSSDLSTPIRLVPDDMPEAASLPQNVEAEAALLGALMIDNRLVEDVQIRLKPEHFFSPLHGRIYEAVLKLADRNMVASPVTLKPLFEGDEEMRALGGPGYPIGRAA